MKSEHGGDDQQTGQLSLAEAFELAQRMHRNAQLAGARTLYERILDIEPNHADAWHFLGLARFQMGEAAAGVSAVRHALSLAPDYADAHANLANMLLQTGRRDDAEAHLQQAIRVAPRAIPPRLTLATIRRAQGRFEEAATEAQTVLGMDPENAYAHVSLGHTLAAQGRLEEAVVRYNLALLYDPESRMSAEHQGFALLRLGRVAEARELFRKWSEAAPDDPKPRHLLAACGGAPLPLRANDDYIRQTFDEFASSFDARLAELDYRAPELVMVAAVARGGGLAEKRVLDAGCGTGLVGERLRPHVRHLVGIDLSPAMLAQARVREIYDELHEAEIVAFLHSRPASFDLVTCADTLCYFGDLGGVCAACFEALVPGGSVVLTLEEAAGEGESFVLQYHGRYAHRVDYVEECLVRAGFRTIAVSREILRYELGAAVGGLVVTAGR